MTAPWEDYLRGRFPGYLLPESATNGLSVEAARHFLEAISGRSDQLDILRAVSLFAPRMVNLRAFVERALSDLVRNLPSRTESLRREWEGGFQGKLSVPATLARHATGRRTTYVTQSRKRSFELPENVLLRAVCERILAALRSLRLAKALPEAGWGLGARECEGSLHRLLSSTALREVPSRSASIADENAARAARHDAYRRAVAWAGWIRDALEDDDEAKIARVVAEGALVPLADSTRFELAVVIRFGEVLCAALQASEPGRWRMNRALVIHGRKDVFAFVRDDGLEVKIFYNQSVLPAGDVDRGGTHYIGNAGRLRPDATLTIARESRLYGALVVECKLSDDPIYILSGYREAALYCLEYTGHLLPWPKAILVASSSISGDVRTRDDVIASPWASWPPPSVIDSIVRCATELILRGPE